MIGTREIMGEGEGEVNYLTIHSSEHYSTDKIHLCNCCGACWFWNSCVEHMDIVNHGGVESVINLLSWYSTTKYQIDTWRKNKKPCYACSCTWWPRKDHHACCKLRQRRWKTRVPALQPKTNSTTTLVSHHKQWVI